MSRVMQMQIWFDNSVLYLYVLFYLVLFYLSGRSDPLERAPRTRWVYHDVPTYPSREAARAVLKKVVGGGGGRRSVLNLIYNGLEKT